MRAQSQNNKPQNTFIRKGVAILLALCLIYVLGRVAVAKFINTPKDVAPSSAAPSRTIEDIDFAQYSQDLAKFTGLTIGQSRGEAVDNIRLYFAPQNADTIIQTTHSVFEREDGAVLLFGASGLPDDSVKAEEIFIITQGSKGSQTLAAYGSRIQCHRGNNTTEWQAAPCP